MNMKEYLFRLVESIINKIELLSNINFKKENETYFIVFKKAMDNKDVNFNITSLLDTLTQVLFKKVNDEIIFEEHTDKMIAFAYERLVYEILNNNKKYNNSKEVHLTREYILDNVIFEFVDVNDFSELSNRPYEVALNNIMIYRINIETESEELRAKISVDVDNEMLKEYDINADQIFINAARNWYYLLYQ